MALGRVWIPSPNYSSRGGVTPRLVVVHTAEGARTFRSLGAFFSSSSAQVSSHTGADDSVNVIGEYVRRENKAWTVAAFNPQALSIELCAFSAWDGAEWARHPNMLNNCAKWIAEECAHYGIPIVRLNASQAQGGGRGVCGHVDLGAAGGGHHDPGPSFPWDRVLETALVGRPSPGGSKPPPGKPAGKAPPFPGTLLKNYTEGHGTMVWQRQMRSRGWSIGVDGKYGGESERVCRQFQAEKGLPVDGIVGPQTWNAAWSAPVT